MRLCSVFVNTVTTVVAIADVESVPENISCISKSPSLETMTNADLSPNGRDLQFCLEGEAKTTARMAASVAGAGIPS